MLNESEVRATQVKEPDGSSTTYGYNSANEKTSISYPNGTQPICFNMQEITLRAGRAWLNTVPFCSAF